ncbi:MAG: M20/M25/M40 family metallo-hydrolase [Candidatus Acidiferrales bacterium]
MSATDGQLLRWEQVRSERLAPLRVVLGLIVTAQFILNFLLPGVGMLRKSLVAVVLCVLVGAWPVPSALAQTRAQAQTAVLPPVAPSSDIAKISDEALVWLQDLIRINTSNPPGNELLVAKYIGGILQKEGIPFEIFESAPGRGIIVARLSSGALPDPSRALLLMAHMDVVGVDKSKWSVDPFGGIIKDGYLYGRGAIDDKGMLAANMATIVALKRGAVRLNRDVIFLAEGDEEAGGPTGMKFAVEKHWDKIAAGSALNEGGYVVSKDGKIQYIGIQASEKVSVNVEVVATGTSGHGSIPRPDNAVVHLAAAIEKIGAYQAPVQLSTITRAYFEQLATVEDEETGKWMRALESPDRQEHAARIISQDPYWNSMLRDTIAPTMLEAGVRANVVPSVARATLNIRLLPGNQLAPLLAKLAPLVNDPQVKFEVEPDGWETAPSSALDSALYKAIAKAASQEFPGTLVLPMMSTGATDSTPLRLRSVQAYGLLPFPLTQEDRLRMHADDERIPLDSFRKGVDFIYRIVTAFAVAQ